MSKLIRIGLACAAWLLALAVAANAQNLAEFETWSKKTIATWTHRLQRARKMGVKIGAGSDMWFRYPGKTRGEATKLMFQALRNEGLPPIAIIRAATVQAAELLGWQDRVGALQANKFADLIAVEGDPLKDITELEQVKFVMKGGTVVRGLVSSLLFHRSADHSRRRLAC